MEINKVKELMFGKEAKPVQKEEIRQVLLEIQEKIDVVKSSVKQVEELLDKYSANFQERK